MSVHPQHEGETEVRQHPDVDPAVKEVLQFLVLDDSSVEDGTSVEMCNLLSTCESSSSSSSSGSSDDGKRKKGKKAKASKKEKKGKETAPKKKEKDAKNKEEKPGKGKKEKTKDRPFL
ncbi:unnamed protein product [Durusdinium trenchii]|uniref:Uncharacterized protein n=1 Tax=Durusdinium trenchii TaxID=1381693 RepID=A0ABP0SY31_9DINO